jgi:hypothetical protein
MEIQAHRACTVTIHMVSFTEDQKQLLLASGQPGLTKVCVGASKQLFELVKPGGLSLTQC